MIMSTYMTIMIFFMYKISLDSCYGALERPDFIDDIHQPARALTVGDDSPSGVTDPGIRHIDRTDHVIGTDVAGAHRSVQNDFLVLVVDLDVAPSLDEQVAVGKHVDDLGRDGGIKILL